MVERDLIIKEKLSHSGIFDFSAFYSYMHSWFKEENYGVIEEKYSEKITPGGRDITFEWKVSKILSDYFKIDHMIKVGVSNLIDVEVEFEGKKRKMNKGKIDIEIKGILLKDHENKWDANPFTRFLRDTYNKYIIKGRIDGLEEKVASDVRTWKDSVKAFLELSGKR